MIDVDLLLIEAHDTAKRINLLNSFMETTEFVELERTDKDLLYIQQRVMTRYLHILKKRLERMNTKFKHIN